MKITLLSLYACGNIGDEAVLAAIVEQIIPLFEKARVNSLGLSPAGMLFTKNLEKLDPSKRKKALKEAFRPVEGGRKFNWRFFFLRFGIFAVLNCLRKSDVVIYAGGYWLHGYKLRVLLLSLAPAIFAKLLRKKVIFLSIGAGPFPSKLSRRITGFVLKKCGLVVARDASSKEALGECGIADRVRVAQDPAFLLEPRPTARLKSFADSNNLQNRRPVCGFSVCAWYKMKFYYLKESLDCGPMLENLASFFDLLIERYRVNILFIPTMFPEDLASGREIAALMRNKDKTLLLDEMYYPRELLAMIADCDCFISMRLHPLIFALKSHVPVLALNYSEKVESLMKEAALEDYLLGMDDSFLKGKNPEFIEVMLERFGAVMNAESFAPQKLGPKLEELKARAQAGFDYLGLIKNP